MGRAQASLVYGSGLRVNFISYHSSDPNCWTKDHVKQWVNWAIKEFSLRDVDVDKFSMTGKELCRITRDEFLKLAPAYNGDILMAHLCVLRKGKPLSMLVSSALF